MQAIRLFLLSAALAAPGLCAAQWQWIDANGRKVYSDQPPPGDIAPKNILKQPGDRAAGPVVITQGLPAAPASAPAPAAAPKASAPKLAGKDKALEEKKKQVDAAEAEKKKAEYDKFLQARADNCKRAREYKAGIDSGVRLTTVDAKGEKAYMDDAQRAAEAKRTDALIARDCGAPPPMPQ